MWFLFRQNLMPRDVPYLLIGAVYHPPKANNAEMTNYLLKVLDAVSQDHPNLGILLLGDLILISSRSTNLSHTHSINSSLTPLEALQR